MTDDEIAAQVVDAAMQVHSAIGPGALESAYHACLLYELRQRGLHVQSNVPLPIVYRGVKLDAGYVIDQLVEHSVIVELKAVSKLHPIHEAQLLSYLKLSGQRLGLLFNFHEVRLKHGIRRLVNGF
jgi:GxxExxY protein